MSLSIRKTTKQGVPDLNGPRMNGSGYNGRRSASCAHHKAPDITPTTRIERMITRDGAIQLVSFVHCLECGAELYENQ